MKCPECGKPLGKDGICIALIFNGKDFGMFHTKKELWKEYKLSAKNLGKDPILLLLEMMQKFVNDNT